MLTTKIHQIVMSNNGIKCADIAKQLDIAINTASGILSMLKLRNLITNDNRQWYVTTETPIVNNIKLRLLDINRNGIDMAWNEGYLSGLADHDIIYEQEFEILLEWIKTIYQ